MIKGIFVEKGKIYLVRCPKCDRENYAMTVATGQCVWCGYKPTLADLEELEKEVSK